MKLVFSSSLLLLLLFLSSFLYFSFGGSILIDPSCSHGECGPMPMVLLVCPNHTVVGYKCLYNEILQRCQMIPPICLNNTNMNTAITSTSSISIDGSLTDHVPIFNCSRLLCGPLISLVILSCPNGHFAHPRCAWLKEQQRCGYMKPSCDYPDPEISPDNKMEMNIKGSYNPADDHDEANLNNSAIYNCSGRCAGDTSTNTPVICVWNSAANRCLSRPS